MKLSHRLFTSALLALSLPLVAFSKGALSPGVYGTIYTPKGKIVCKLEYEKAPITVINFVGLAEGTKTHNRKENIHFYDGLNFHRVEPGFVIQGGDPNGNGSGGPGYQFTNEIDPTLKHDRAGILAMANAGPNTNGSQFYITFGPTPSLDGGYSVFGSVVDSNSMNVVKAIAVGDKIDSIRITRVGAKAKEFKATEEAFQAAIKNHDAFAAEQAKKNQVIADAAKKKAAEDFKKLEAKATTTPSGLKYVVITPGMGPKPTRGTKVKVHYTGTLTDGTKFDSSRDRNQPFEFTVGVGQVIPGWDEALQDMQKGERRMIIIPPNLGYGAAGAGGVIPPNATLIFDVELLDF